MRSELYIDLAREINCISTISQRLRDAGLTATNSIIVTVSTDYSAIAGQIIRHELTDQGEIADGFAVDVPYPDQTWDTKFINEAKTMFLMHRESIANKHIVLVEAGVIRGSNYKRLIELIQTTLNFVNPIVTTTLFENIHSAFKCDHAAEFYDDATQDLTFWWEQPNNHWIQ